MQEGEWWFVSGRSHDVRPPTIHNYADGAAHRPPT
jgi:hypothetical protein